MDANKSAGAIRWPERPAMSDPWRVKFATAFNELLTERQHTHAEFAQAMFADKHGNLKHSELEITRKWHAGESFPNSKNAAKIATYFSVPLARLLTPQGPTMTIAPTVPKREKHASAAPTLPDGAPPVIVKLETFAKDSRFMVVTISGTLETDTALAVMALVQGRR